MSEPKTEQLNQDTIEAIMQCYGYTQEQAAEFLAVYTKMIEHDFLYGPQGFRGPEGHPGN